MDKFDGTYRIYLDPSQSVRVTWKLAILLLSVGFVHTGIKLLKSTGSKNFVKSRKIPGPTSLPFFGMLHHFIGADVLQLLTKFTQKYGKIFGGNIFTFELVLLNDPLYIQKLLTSTSPAHLNKPHEAYDAIMGGNIANGTVSADYVMWKGHRKVISRPMFIHHQIERVNLHIRKMIFQLRSITEADGAQVFHIISDNALGMVLEIAMGNDAVVEEAKQKFHQNVIFNRFVAGQRITKPWLLLEPIWRLHPLRKEMMKSLDKLRSFLDDLFNECENCESENRESHDDDDVGGKYRESMMTEMKKAGFSNEDIFQEVLALVVAGYEATSWSALFLLLKLALHSEHQEKCRLEVDSLFEKKLKQNSGSLSEEFDLTLADVNSLEHLDRCVKESMRLTPTLPIFARKLDGPLKLEDDLILKKGTIVGLFPWGTHRNPEIYPDPEKFDPDRFLPEEVAKRHSFAYFPFSAGPRNCAGAKLALFFNKLVVIQILRNFVVETTDKWESLKFLFEVSLTAEKINLSVRKRTDAVRH